MSDLMGSRKSQGRRQRECSDCRLLLSSPSTVAGHARATGHMASCYCDPCQRLFDRPVDLKRHLRDSPKHRAASTAPPLRSEELQRGHLHTTGTHAMSSRPRQGVANSIEDRSPNTSRYESPPPGQDAGIIPTPSAVPITSLFSESRLEAAYQRMAIAPSLNPQTSLERIQRNPGPDSPFESWQRTGSSNTGERGAAQESVRLVTVLVFEPPPQYPVVDVSTGSQLLHGRNKFSLFTSTDQQVLFEALVLRCNSEERLLDRKFLLPSRRSSWTDIRLPAGICSEDFIATPAPSGKVARRVVAIDCEMVGVWDGNPSERGERSELAQLCAVDVLTGEVLIDKLVSPGEKVINWRTRYSGISPATINSARAGGRLLRGWRTARAELWSHIDVDTILVGHDLQSDLHVLRVAHAKIVDTTMQTAEAVFGNVPRFRRTWGLKSLADSLLGIKVQVGKRGHDCVEDTLTTRELALWCIRSPADLEAWAAQMRHDLQKEHVEWRERAERRERRWDQKEAENPV